MSRKIQEAILRIRPDLGALEGYFYFRPVDHVLCGFVCETRPNGAHIVPYLFPLYSGEKQLHLTFGEPLAYPEDLVGPPKGGEAGTARKFVATMERHEARIRALQDLATFAAYLGSEKPLENPWIRRAYALTLILLDRATEAETELQMLRGRAETARYPGFDAAISRISADLARGVEAAKARLDAWEAEARAHFRLS